MNQSREPVADPAPAIPFAGLRQQQLEDGGDIGIDLVGIDSPPVPPIR
jgi:hypothetical protein